MMLFKTISLTSAALFLAAATLPASDAPTAPMAQKAYSHNDNHAHSHKTGYVKPGAAIELRHDYDGLARAGDIETVTLSLSHMYDEGFLTVALLPDAALTIMSGGELQSHSLQSGSVITLPVQFSAGSEGRHSLGVEVVYESMDGFQSRRVTSVPIPVGIAPLRKVQQIVPAAPSKAESLKTGNDAVIGMTARETIR